MRPATPGPPFASRLRPTDEIDVEDDGPGVEPGAEALMRKRGGRLDESGGAGLGIAIVEEILAAYGGSLQFDRSTLGGLKAKLALPLGSS